MTTEKGDRKLLFTINAEQALAFAGLVAAANAGDGGAACRLGDLYREGLEGLRYSPKQAYRWYAKSALAGDANGQNNLGACYEHGLGCTQSYAKAVKWYRLAAAQELAYASSNLGYCYLRGHGVPADTSTALGWFEKALAQGDERAEEMVEQLGGAVRPGQPAAAHKRVKPDWLLDVYAMSGRVPEEFEPELASRYRAYLAQRGITAEALETNRKCTDLAQRAWDKDDCFDMPHPDSPYGKHIRQLVDDIFAARNARGKSAPEPGS